MKLLISFLISLSTLLATAAPIEVAGEGLDESTWKVTEKGLWLVEHYSPYCSHCRAFAPKWKELVDMFSLTGPRHSFNFAQVDCAANGDLCHQHEVKYYPSIFLYEDGKFKEEYTERRSIEELARYVEGNWREVETLPVEETREVEEEEMGRKVRPRPAKGAEKARLPKLHLEEEEDEKKEEEGSEDEKPYDLLLDDASSQIKAFLDPSTASLNTETISQSFTPPATSASASSTLQPAQFFAQQPESKRSAESEGSSLTQEWEKTRGSPDGTVKLLTKKDAERFKDQDAGPSFVKYYAPWCGHCKKLAPHWESLASSLENQVHIYQVDCDASENKGICRQEGVQAYPTLIFYNRGAVVEYHGRREEKAMKEWALKTIDATTLKHVSNKYELEKAVERDSVVVLMLFSNDNEKDDIALAREAAQSQMGPSTPFYASSSPELFSHFSVPPSSPPTFLIFKSSSLSPTGRFSLPSKPLTRRKRVDQTRSWLRSAKLPVVSELDGSSYSDLFPEDSDPSNPFVVLGFFSKKGLKGEFDETMKRFKRLAEEWNRESKLEGRRSVAWAWVDGDRWAPWSRSSYDVKMGAVDAPVLLVSDPHNRVYWKNDLSGDALKVEDSKVFDLIRKGVLTGTVAGVSSDNFVGRWSKAFVRRSSSFFSLAMSHPFLTFFAVVSSWVGLALILQKVFAPSPTSGTGGNSFKSDEYVKKD
ncbi:uncharacterized protein JCM6883_003897 [Sporobolomyces salmoneus]|uniref:uncharacterized protein n=1 Tax=Sporobolomyces salmoneus TaxID=183962 RepID=UPI00316BC50A